MATPPAAFLMFACPAQIPFPLPLPCACSVSWSQRGSYLSIGTDKGEVQIWDATKCKR